MSIYYEAVQLDLFFVYQYWIVIMLEKAADKNIYSCTSIDVYHVELYSSIICCSNVLSAIIVATTMALELVHCNQLLLINRQAVLRIIRLAMFIDFNINYQQNAIIIGATLLSYVFVVVKQITHIQISLMHCSSKLQDNEYITSNVT